ncbi:MAG: YbhB/YbcL family Raf kinase inhibitor-like protein [Burkholderiales bacterium]|jgi:Raf kinase inhibitor-like YbhB/YbcL family protein
MQPKFRIRQLTVALAAAAMVGAIAPAAAKTGFTISSPTVKDGATLTLEQVFKGFGCEGKNVSPALEWKGAPKDTKSFAVTVYDPDAPTGSGWWHWVMFNIPADVSKLEADAGNPGAGKAPKGAVQSRTDFGAPGFGGACPPEGSKKKPHRYIFTVYALKVDKLDLDANASGALVGYMINANKLGKASFTARYGR